MNKEKILKFISTYKEINIKNYWILFENNKNIKVQSGKNYENSDCLALISMSNELN